ncbi:MAG TPA: 2-oxo acid dehydrogenase subunit E2, partial [Candidatus Limiplasma sp.]|nr:2-oxo acid dehydrogenase subunit E2 [Candidatus Limiplasma sp.]
INPPQVGILGVNTIKLMPRRAADGTVEFYDCMTLSLTYDHRAVDGAPASRFLQALCKNLESFTLLLGGARI